MNVRFPELRAEPRALARADFRCRQALAFRWMWHTKTGFALMNVRFAVVLVAAGLGH